VEDLFELLPYVGCTPQDGPHARHQLPETEWLGHVVTRTQLEAEHDVDL
jgi:hypothetical protein